MISRTVLHGTCLLGGRHKDLAMAASCPVLRAQGAQGDPEIAPAVGGEGVRTASPADTQVDIAPASAHGSGSRQERHRSRRIAEAGGVEEYRRRERERVRALRASRKRPAAEQTTLFDVESDPSV